MPSRKFSCLSTRPFDTGRSAARPFLPRRLARTERCHFESQSFRTHLCSRMSKSRRTRLHRLAYRLFERRHTDEELLAYHSFHGRLHGDAARHCLKIAKDMCEEGNYTVAITFYSRAKLCLRHLGRELDSAAKADLALCYGRVGKSACANKIYQDLLARAP